MLPKEIADYPETPPLSGKADKLLVLLHGVGSDGHDLIGLVPFIQESLPNYHFISPHGVEPYDMAPFGRQWFSLKDRDNTTICRLVKNNSTKLQKIIENKQNELGIKNSDTVLVGFSQGTMMASYLTLIQKEPFAAMVGFSGRLVKPADLKTTSTPICIIHGLDDDVVPANQSKEFAKYCQNNKISYQLHLIQNLTHSIDGSGMQFALNFLRGIKLSRIM